jgi:hypothetical protein
MEEFEDILVNSLPSRVHRVDESEVVSALKIENSELKAEVERLQALASRISDASTKAVRQRSIATIKFHHMSKSLRRHVDALFQRPSLTHPVVDPEAPPQREVPVENSQEEFF